MNSKEKLLYLLKEYYNGNYSTDIFADQFNFIFGRETDSSFLSTKEYELMSQLSTIAGRYSEFEEDHFRYPGVYYNEKDVKDKATEVYLYVRESEDIKFLRIINECLEEKEEFKQILPIYIEDLIGSKELVEKCIDYISDEFCKKALKEDYEPDEYGVLLEDTIRFLSKIVYNVRN